MPGPKLPRRDASLDNLPDSSISFLFIDPEEGPRANVWNEGVGEAYDSGASNLGGDARQMSYEPHFGAWRLDVEGRLERFEQDFGRLEARLQTLESNHYRFQDKYDADMYDLETRLASMEKVQKAQMDFHGGMPFVDPRPQIEEMERLRAQERAQYLEELRQRRRSFSSVRGSSSRRERLLN